MGEVEGDLLLRLLAVHEVPERGRQGEAREDID
jgi:hypothetical protein